MTDNRDHEKQALWLQDRIAQMSDDEVRAAYEASDEEAGDPFQDALAVAMQERSIDE